MRIHLKVWRQADPRSPGELVDYTAENVSPDMSFLEMLDVVNEGLIAEGEDPIAFDSDCREGICGTCGFLIERRPARARSRARRSASCTCAASRTATGSCSSRGAPRRFPLIKDLVVDRSAFDRIIQAGGYTSVNVGGAQDGNAILIPGHVSNRRWIRRPASAAARAWRPARTRRRRSSPPPRSATWRCCRRARSSANAAAVAMVERHDAEGFGSCSNEGECEAVCPKEISITNIARMNREYLRAVLAR